MSASGRKRTLISVVYGVPERPLCRKADIPEYPQDFHKIDQLGTSAFRPKPDIKLILVKRSANDPKRTSHRHLRHLVKSLISPDQLQFKTSYEA